MIDKKYIECGKIINTHGIAGYLKIESYSDTSEDNMGLKRMYFLDGDNYKELKIEKVSEYKGLLLVKFNGYNDIDEALKLKGKFVYALREDYNYDDTRIFLADIIGLNAIDFESGNVIGKVDNILTDRVQNIYVVKTVDEKEVMIPDVDVFVKKIAVSGDDKGLYVSLIEGMID